MQTKKSNIDVKVKRTMTSMMIGSSLFNLLLLALSVIIFVIYCWSKNISNSYTIKFILKNILCILIGYICSLIAIYSMTMSVVKAVDFGDEKFAKRHLVISSLVRLFVFCIILILIINEKVFGFVGGMMFVLAVLGVKVGTYLSPTIEKYVQSMYMKE